MIRISAIVPTYNRPIELRTCLEGFAAQTAPRDDFEVLVIDDGSAENMELLVMEFAHSMNISYRRIDNSGPSVARNLGIDQAAAPLLLLYEDDLSPRPGMIEYCLRFHESQPDESHASLLWFRPAPSIRSEPLIQWAFPRLYPFPAAAGVYNWIKFWSGTLTCKKSIFRFGRFSEQFRCLEDAELALRLTRRLDLRVHFERRTLGLYTRPLALPQVLARSYSMGFYDYRLSRKYPGAYGRDTVCDPERMMVPAAELPGLMAAAKALAATRPEPGSSAFRMLSALWTRADLHAHMDGWRTARDGGPCEPPGTLSRFLEAM